MKIFFNDFQSSNILVSICNAIKMRQQTLIYGEASTGKVTIVSYIFDLIKDDSMKLHLFYPGTKINKIETLFDNKSNVICFSDLEQWSASAIDYICNNIFKIKAWQIITISYSKYELIEKYFSKYMVEAEKFQLIYMPSLRERKDELLLLARKVIEDASKRYKLSLKNFSRCAKNFILTYPWYGNFHEFNTVLMKGFFYSKSDIITEQDLQRYVKVIPESMERSIEDFENYLREILKDFRYTDLASNQKLYSTILGEADKVFVDFAMKQMSSIKKACQYLGISSNTFRKKFLKNCNAK